MTHPTDEELDALVGMLQQRDKSKHGYTGHPLYNRNGPQAAAAITALRAQLAEAWAKLSQRVDMHECAMAERDDATLYGVEQKARADRAEAALAAQIEADAGIAQKMRENWMCAAGFEGFATGAKNIMDAIRAQPHDRTALDRMLRDEREKALREAAEVIHRIADGYDAGGDKAIACGLYLTEGNVLAMIPKEGA